MSKNNLKLSIEIENNVTNLGEAEQYIDSLEQMGLNIDHLRKRSAQLVDAWDDLTPRKRTQQMRRLREAISSTADGTLDLKKETADLAKTKQKTVKSTEKLRKSSGKLDKTYGKLRNRIVAVGSALVTYFSVKKITGFFSLAVSGAAELEEQLDKVQAVSGATNKEMQRVSETAKKLGGSTKYTATQAAQGFEILARAGLSANESITAIPAVLDLAAAAGIELAEAASYITKSVAGMNLSMTDSGRVADALAKAAASANTDVSGLGQALSYAAPSAAALGLSLEETVAIIGKFADAGIDASRAGTALNSILAQFANPASKFRQELSAIGINTNNFSDALRALAKSGDKGQKAILAVGQEAGPALKALLAQGIPALDELIQKLRLAEGSAGSMAEVMNNNLKGALTGLGSRWQTLKDTLGKPFLAPVTERVRELSDIIKGFVDSGKIEQLGQTFAAAFDKMLRKALAFIKDFNLIEVSQSINDFATNFSEKFNAVEAVFSTVYNVLATGFNTIKSIIFGVASAVADAAAVIAGANAKLLDFLPGMEQAAKNMREHAGGMAAVADEFGRRAAKAFDDATASANRLQNSITTLTTATRESTEAARQNTAAINAETEAFNAKSGKLAELKQAEKDYIAQGKKNSQEYNDVVRDRINLETELTATIKDKVLLSYEESDATNKLVTSKSNNATTENKVAESVKKTTQAVRENAQAVRENAQANKEQAQTAKESGGIWQALASNIDVVKQQFVEFPSVLETFETALEGNISKTLTVSEMWSAIGDAEQYAIVAKKRHIEAIEQVDTATQRLSDAINDGTLSMSDIEAATASTTLAMHELDEANLSKLNETIDAARQKLQSLEDKARETAAAIADRLADATGDANDKINRKFQREIDNIRKQQAQANGVGSEHYSKAIADLEKLKQIELKKQREREQEAEKRKAEAEKKAAERQRQSDERLDKSSPTTSAPNQTTDERARAYRNTTGGAAGGNTVVLQLGNEKINIDGVTDEVMRRINQQLRQYQKGRGR